MDDKFALLSQQIKTMEDNMMRITGDHETRIHKLEHPNEREPSRWPQIAEGRR